MANIKNTKSRGGDVTQWYSTCPECFQDLSSSPSNKKREWKKERKRRHKSDEDVENRELLGAVGEMLISTVIMQG